MRMEGGREGGWRVSLGKWISVVPTWNEVHILNREPWISLCL